MKNFYNYDSEFEKELESKVEETLDLIKTERAEKRKLYDDEEELVMELNIKDADAHYIEVATDMDDVSFMFKKVSEQDLDFIFDEAEEEPLPLYKSSIDELEIYYDQYEIEYF